MSDELEYPQERIYFNILPEGIIDIIINKVKNLIYSGNSYFFWRFIFGTGIDSDVEQFKSIRTLNEIVVSLLHPRYWLKAFCNNLNFYMTYLIDLNCINELKIIFNEYPNLPDLLTRRTFSHVIRSFLRKFGEILLICERFNNPVVIKLILGYISYVNPSEEILNFLMNKSGYNKESILIALGKESNVKVFNHNKFIEVMNRYNIKMSEPTKEKLLRVYPREDKHRLIPYLIGDNPNKEKVRLYTKRILRLFNKDKMNIDQSTDCFMILQESAKND